MREQTTKKTLIIGLGAASWDYLEPLLKANRLPTLRRLRDNGISGTLRSTLPAQTPPVWASIVTGKNPGTHGIYDHLWRRPGSYEFTLPNSRVRLGTPFWARLNERGVRVGLVNVPYSHPPDPIDGLVVCGFGTPPSATDAVFPDEALAWIQSEWGRYEPWLASKQFRDVPPEDRLRAERAHQAAHIRMTSGGAYTYGDRVS